MSRLLPLVLVAFLVIITSSDIPNEIEDIGAAQLVLSKSLSESKSNPPEEKLKNKKSRYLREKQRKGRDKTISKTKTKAKNGKMKMNLKKRKSRNKKLYVKKGKKTKKLNQNKKTNPRKNGKRNTRGKPKNNKKRKGKNKQKKNRKQKKNKKKKKTKKTKNTKHLSSRDVQTYLDNIKATMFYESTVVTNVLVQILRTNQWLKLIESKRKKKESFEITAGILGQALAKSPIPSTHNRLAQRSFENARANKASLSNCSALIEENCVSSSDRFEAALADSLHCLPDCNSTMHAIKAKIVACDRATPENKCSCWAEARGLVEKAKNGTCKEDTLNAQESVKEKKTTCINAYRFCKQELSSAIANLKNLLDKVEETNLTITEEYEGQQITYQQTNKYNPTDGVITLEIPAHKEYSDTIITLIPKAEKQVINTAGVCLVSNNTADIKKMRDDMRNNNSRSLRERFTKHVLKTRKSIIGGRNRSDSDVNIGMSCINRVLIETEDVNVNQTIYDNVDKMEENGELKEVWNETVDFSPIESINVTRNNRVLDLPCWMSGGKTGKNNESCGNGFIFDDLATDGVNFNIHLLSSVAIKIECCSQNRSHPAWTESCCKDKLEIFSIRQECICEKIKHKTDLMKCFFGTDIYTKTFTDKTGGEHSETMQFYTISSDPTDHPNSKTGAIKITTSKIEANIHTAFNGYWHHDGGPNSIVPQLTNNMVIKKGQFCNIYTLPKDIHPVEMFHNFQNLPDSEAVPFVDIEEYHEKIVCVDETSPIKLHADMNTFCDGTTKRICSNKRYNGPLQQIGSIWLPMIIRNSAQYVQRVITYEAVGVGNPSTSSTTTKPATVSPGVWKCWDTGCYQFFEANTANKAKEICESNGAHLIEITNQAKQNDAYEFYKENLKPNGGYIDTYRIWLGARDEITEGEWIWPSGAGMSFNAWINDEQPAGGDTEDCLTTVKGFKWTDFDCDKIYEGAFALCERK